MKRRSRHVMMVIAAVLLLFVVLWWRSHDRRAGTTSSAVIPVGTVDGAAGAPLAARDASDRIAHIRAWAADGTLSVSQQDALLVILDDRATAVHVRNAAANALVMQPAMQEELAERFWAMLADTRETVQWRGYAVQFLFVLLVQDAAVVERDKLRDLVSHSEEHIASTAIVQWSHLVRRGLVPESGWLRRVVHERLLTGTDRVPARVSDLGVLAMIGDASSAELVRGIIRSDPPDALLRVAIATLGHIGAATDRHLLMDVGQHADAAVRMAADVAMARLPGPPP